MGIFSKLSNARQQTTITKDARGVTSSYNGAINVQSFLNNQKKYNYFGETDNIYADLTKLTQQSATMRITSENKKLNAVLAQPNEDFSQSMFLMQLYTHILTYGHVYIIFWEKPGARSSEKPVSRGAGVSIDKISSITIATANMQLTNEESAAAHLITYGVDPKSIFNGYSPTQASNAWRRAQDAMGSHITSFAENNGLPQGMFEVTANNPEDFEIIRNNLNARVNSANKGGGSIFSYKPSSSSEAQVKWINFSAEKAQDYKNSLDFSSEKIASNWGVPSLIKGVLKNDTYATARVSEQVFIKYTVKPLVDIVTEQIEKGLFQRFTGNFSAVATVHIPEIAEEATAKIASKRAGIELLQEYIDKGHDAETVVQALGLPEEFLLLYKDDTAKKSKKTEKHKAEPKKEKKENAKGEGNVLADAIFDILQTDFTPEAKRGALIKLFSEFYEKQFFVSAGQVENSIADLLGVAEMGKITFNDDDKIQIEKLYGDRAQSYIENFLKLSAESGDSVSVQNKLYDRAKLIADNELEYTRTLAAQNANEKAGNAYPVRIQKKWMTVDDRACELCKSLEATVIDVTDLFIDNNAGEEYRVTAGLAHVNCRCSVGYFYSKADGTTEALDA